MLFVFCCLIHSSLPAADDFVDELAADGIELILANPSQQVRCGREAPSLAGHDPDNTLCQLARPEIDRSRT